MVSDEQIAAAWLEAVDAANRASVAAQSFNLLLAQACLERRVPPGFTLDPTTGKQVPVPR